jgi:hypothetical protein
MLPAVPLPEAAPVHEAERRVDQITMGSGVTGLPTEFREVARLANEAGMAGFRFIDVEYDAYDIEEVRRDLLDDDAAVTSAPPPRILLTYQKKTYDAQS